MELSTGVRGVVGRGQEDRAEPGAGRVPLDYDSIGAELVLVKAEVLDRRLRVLFRAGIGRRAALAGERVVDRQRDDAAPRVEGLPGLEGRSAARVAAAPVDEQDRGAGRDLLGQRRAFRAVTVRRCSGCR